MSFKNLFQKVPSAPTNPRSQLGEGRLSITDLYEQPEQVPLEEASHDLDEKLRRAYFWIANTAIISPFYDLEFNDDPPRSFTFGDSKAQLSMPTGQCYSSFVLIPLLNLVVRKRCLLVGGPGRGKTATAVLMGVLSGYDLIDIKRAIQHGQPQMTIADLLGHPLPSDMIKAAEASEIKIAWRKWLSMRVKIIDEYNRIPTRTQSALLTVLGDNYAEIMDQVFECPEAAWFLTANDDAGGGTYQVIEALRDRIDVVVKALHFNTRFIGDLLRRIEMGFRPEADVPHELVFSESELDDCHRLVLSVAIPESVRRRLEFFCRHFEFLEQASPMLEYMTKDTAKLSGLDYHSIVRRDSGKDAHRELGVQTRNGLSVRKLMNILVFSKALAWFRGSEEVSLEDVHQIMPFVLHDTLSPYLEAPFFEKQGHGPYRVDRIGWIRELFTLSCKEYDRLKMDSADPIDPIARDFSKGLDGLSLKETDKRIFAIEKALKTMSEAGKLYSHMADDILQLKYYHQRYTNYRRWLKWTQ